MAAILNLAHNKTGNVQPTFAVTAPFAASSSPTVEYLPLPNGVDATFTTLEAMKAAVLGQMPPGYSGWRDEFNQQTAHAIAFNRASEIHALFYFARDQIVYVEHPWNLQVVKDCRRAIESRSGDCVTKSVALATLLACRGHISRFVAQAPDGEAFNHVYCEVEVIPGSDEWIALDPTADGRDGRPFGDVGWFQVLSDNGIETTGRIF
jgi:transglutaminase-like putative cysteine protease